MNVRTIVALSVVSLMLSGCNALNETRSVGILFQYEGMPRAHLPAVAWFSGSVIPRFAEGANHDNLWALRYAGVPKFALTDEVFKQVESMLNESSEAPSAYRIEFLFESERPKIRYLDLKSFERVRLAFREAQIRGHEILADWPTAETKQ